METVLIESIDDFNQLGSDWEDLLARYPGKNPFLSFDWMISWLEAFGKNVRLTVISVRHGGRLCGIAPLCVQQGGILTFIGYPQNDYADFIVDPNIPGVLEKIVTEIIFCREKWSRAILDQFPQENSQWHNLIEILQNERIFFRLELSDASHAMIIDDVAAAKKKYFKRRVKNYINWYNKNGKLSFSANADKNTVMQGLEDLFSQHIDRWKNTATPSSFLKVEMKEFHRKFVRRMNPKAMVHIASLSFNDKPLAVELFFEYNKTLYLYKGSFNLNYYKKSPGQVSMRYLFDYALERDVKEIDFTRGDEKYKGWFTNTANQNRRIILYKNRFSMLAAEIFYSFRYSRFIDILYRNHWVQNLKFGVIKFYHRHAGN